MPKKTKHKTFAFTPDGTTFRSGWTLDGRRFEGTISPERVISTTKFDFVEHNWDKNSGSTSIPGSYYASYVEAQALCDVRGDIAILVSRPMCNSCQKFVQHLAKERQVTYIVGTPDSIQIFSKGRVKERDAAQGKTSVGMKWSMRHEGQQATMHVEHPAADPTVTNPIVISVHWVLSSSSSSSEGPIEYSSNREGPIAYYEHAHFDTTVEKVTYFQTEEGDITTLFPGTGKKASPDIGPSGGVRESLGDGNEKRVPKKELGLKNNSESNNSGGHGKSRAGD